MFELICNLQVIKNKIQNKIFKMTEKLIAIGEIFSSWSEFQDALKAFSEQTFQVFTIEDSKRLKPKVNPDSQLKFKTINILLRSPHWVYFEDLTSKI